MIITIRLFCTISIEETNTIGYYERFLHTLETHAVAKGLITREELDVGPSCSGGILPHRYHGGVLRPKRHAPSPRSPPRPGRNRQGRLPSSRSGTRWQPGISTRQGTPGYPGRMVENLGCLYPIEVAQVECILDRTISSRPPI